MNFSTAVRWVVALKHEASPILSKYKMRKVEMMTIFSIFKNDEGSHWLVISGVGKINCSAATMFLHLNSKAPVWALWLNVGIAGYGGDAFGNLYSVNQITDEANLTKRFPSFTKVNKIPSAPLMSVDYVVTEYESGLLYDMEGVAFYSVANKLVCKELILLLKVVSDCPTSPFLDFRGKVVSELIFDNLEKIDDIINSNVENMFYEYECHNVPVELDNICSRLHVTVVQRHKLKALIKSWKIAYPKVSITLETNDKKDTKELIEFLSDRLSGFTADWTRS